jgi:LacI family transcriptional regulator
VQISDFREEGGYQTALRMLALETPPTAIFVANNLMCAGVLRALHDMRVGVPGELSVIGFDDLHLAELLDPPLTVIGRPTDEQGALAMRLLLNLLAGEAARPRRIVLNTRLVIRESCVPAAPGAPANLNGTRRPRA